MPKEWIDNAMKMEPLAVVITAGGNFTIGYVRWPW